MKKFLMVVLLLVFASNAFASVLMTYWTEGTKTYCKYYDGTIITVNATELCPLSN